MFKLIPPLTRLDNKIKGDNIKNYILYIILFMSSFFECFFYSLETSPKTPTFHNLDAPMFELIGKAWANGFTPYVDFWDLKGPFVFFMNMLGFLFFNSLYGVFIFELLFLFLAKIALFKIVNLKYSKIASCFISCFVLTFFEVIQWDYGNTAASWCLPFLCLSFYFIYKYFLNNFENHKPIYAFVYGLSISICVLSRFSNAVPLIFSICCIGIILIHKKEYKNIFKNILFGLAGLSIPMALFSIYFYLNNALYEMWYGTLIFNLKYLKTSATGNNANYFNLIVCNIFILLFLLLCIKKIIKKDFKYLFFFVPILGSLLFFLTTNCFVHYFLVLLPFIYIYIAELKDETISPLIYILMLAQLVINIIFFEFNLAMFPKMVECQNIENKLFSYIPKDSTFLMIDASFQGIYLDNDIYPNNKCFDLQSWTSNFSDEYKDFALDDFCSNEPEYVIVEKNKNMKCIYKDVLKNDYKELKNIDNFYLYIKNGLDCSRSF